MKKSTEILTADLSTTATNHSRYDDPETGLERSLAGVLAEVVHVEPVPVDAHFFEDLGADSLVMAHFCARVRKRDDLPSVSMKDIYQHPTVSSLAKALVEAAPLPVGQALPTTLAEVLAGVMHLDRVPVDAHFFDDLGADSLVMAHFCARLRKLDDLPSVSMKDVYQHPTVSSLAAAFADTAPAPAPSPASAPAPAPAEVVATATTPQYILCGTLQLLVFVGYTCVAALIASRGYEWISAAASTPAIYLRSVVFGGASFLALCALPILAKWVLVGRWKPQQIPIWSLAYFRFWLVKTLIRSSPLALVMVGTPLYPLYLRALGAHVGRGVAIFTRTVPVCTDLLSIGDGTVVRKESFINGYRAHAGVIQTGSVNLGKDVFVGEKTVLDIATSMGDGAQLGHSSSLNAGQAVPSGERWHGSPAERASVDYRGAAPAHCGSVRRVAYSIQQMLTVLLVYLPLAFGGMAVVLTKFPTLNSLLDPGTLALESASFYRDALVASVIIFFGGVIVGLVLVVVLPRLLNLTITPDKVYHLYGFHYSVHRTIARLSNSKFFTYLFGDSSYILGYLRSIGYVLRRPIQQTGSNFGTGVTHETPFMSSIGSGTMVADGLSIVNADFSSTSFRVSRASIGSHSFLGNHIAYPWQARVGENCLLATKVMVPIDGPVREGVGLLGSPSFEIPRSVQRDSSIELKSRGEFRRRLGVKNRYNLRTIGLALVVRWAHFLGITLLAMATADIYQQTGVWSIAADLFLTTLFTMGYFILAERAIARFRPLRPQFCSIYDPYFRWHERFWKMVVPTLDRILVGTPYKNVVSRLLGVRIGKQVFDDGCIVPERTLATIGDFCTLNAGSTIQCHSQEDGAFKSDYTVLGAGCTIGVGALVHYGVTIGDGVVLAPDSFLMKGEDVPPHTQWGGNPAREMRDHPVTLPARRSRKNHRNAALVSSR